MKRRQRLPKGLAREGVSVRGWITISAAVEISEELVVQPHYSRRFSLARCQLRLRFESWCSHLLRTGHGRGAMGTGEGEYGTFFFPYPAIFFFFNSFKSYHHGAFDFHIQWFFVFIACEIRNHTRVYKKINENRIFCRFK